MKMESTLEVNILSLWLNFLDEKIKLHLEQSE